MEFSHIPVLYNEVLTGLNIKPDGVYAANVISPAEGYGSMPLIMAKSILKNHFKTVKMWQVNRDRDPKERQNCILYAKNPIIR